jgi:class 3 adenylate cyclase
MSIIANTTAFPWTAPETTQTGRLLLSRSSRQRPSKKAPDETSTAVCVMVVDMAHFAQIQHHLQLLAGDKAMKDLADQIHRIMSEGCAKAGQDYAKVCASFGGDGGIFVFNKPSEAHEAAVHMLKLAEEESARGREAKLHEAMRCFRIGIAYGELARDDHGKLAGPVISNATRLESGGVTGEIRVSTAAYKVFPRSIQRLYGGEEEIRGKKHEKPQCGHRCVVVPRAPWDEPMKSPVRNPDFNTHAIFAHELVECFIITEIDDRNPRISEVMEKMVVPACKRANFLPRRADRIPGPDRIAVIKEQLAEAPLVVAYLGQPKPHWNADVILEVGFRLATGRPMVMIHEAPPPSLDGSVPSLKALLPFYLLHRTTVEVAPQPQQSLDRLVAEINLAQHDHPEGKWSSTHPKLELQFSNLRTDLRVNEVSAEARELFGLDNHMETHRLAGVFDQIRQRMDEVQFKAFLREQSDILSRIQAEGSGLMAPENGHALPLARVPIIFKNPSALETDRKPLGHLPVLERYSSERGLIKLRMLFIPVSESLHRDPSGHWLCDV